MTHNDARRSTDIICAYLCLFHAIFDTTNLYTNSQLLRNFITFILPISQRRCSRTETDVTYYVTHTEYLIQTEIIIGAI